MATTIPNLFNATEAAKYLGLTDSMVRNYCRQQRIKAERVGRNWVITKRELDRFKKTPRPIGNPNLLRHGKLQKPRRHPVGFFLARTSPARE